MGNVNERMIDTIIAKIEEDDSAEHINIKDKVELVKMLSDKLSETACDGVDVTCHINEPFKSMAYISVTGKDIIFSPTDAIAAASASASNIEVYPKLDGTIVMNLTFHGISRKSC